MTMIGKVDRFSVMRVFSLLIFMMPLLLKADHYYGGFINYTHVHGWTYHVKVITYADNDKVNSDRDSIIIKWGDGEEEFLHRTNNMGNGNTVYPGVKKNIYEGTHSYQKEGNFKLVFQDQYRMFDVVNMSPGKSGTTLLYFSAIIPIGDSTTHCVNNSPTNSFEPYMWVKSGEKYQLNLTHYDQDGDSLRFNLVSPKAKNDIAVQGYYRPSDLNIDPNTGLLTWNNPSWGTHIYAYEIEEYRDGQLIGLTIVDLPIFVNNEYDERGTFSTIGNTTNNFISLNGPTTEDFTISYDNPSADSVFLNYGAGLEQSIYFNSSDKYGSNGKESFDTLTIDYLGNDKQQGPHIVSFQAGSIYGSDTIYDYISFLVSTKSDTSWTCTMPSDLKDTETIAPDVPQLTISPNLFEESVWVNLGTSYENLTVEIYDLRGRLVLTQTGFESQTVQFELGHLRRSMYMFRIWRGEELVTVLKSVKK